MKRIGSINLVQLIEHRKYPHNDLDRRDPLDKQCEVIAVMTDVAIGIIVGMLLAYVFGAFSSGVR